MPKKTIISFDLDDVVVGFSPILMQELEKSTGNRVPHHHIENYDDFHTYYQLKKYPEELIIDRKLLERSPVNDHAHEAFHLAKEQGHDIIIVTARAWHPLGYDITDKWLKANKLPFDKLHVVAHGVGKRQIFDRYENIAWHIDDIPKYVMDAHAHPNIHHAAIMHQPWNTKVEENGENLHRVASLKAFHDLLRSSDA